MKLNEVFTTSELTQKLQLHEVMYTARNLDESFELEVCHSSARYDGLLSMEVAKTDASKL